MRLQGRGCELGQGCRVKDLLYVVGTALVAGLTVIGLGTAVIAVAFEVEIRPRSTERSTTEPSEGSGDLAVPPTPDEGSDGNTDLADPPPTAGVERSPQRTRRFSGNGSKNVGTIKVTDDAVLTWRNPGDEIGGSLFIVMDEEAKINVNSQGKRGSSALEPGTYRNVDVTANGEWTMTIKGR